MNTMRKLLGGALASAGLLTALTAPAAAATTPPQVELVAYGGSGCPNNTANFFPNLDGSGFTATYDAFEARTPRDPALKACTLTIDIEVPAGLRVGIRKVTYRGEAALTRNGAGEFKAKYFYQGKGKTLVHPGWSEEGEYEGEWQTTHNIKEAYWSECGKTARLNITQNLKVTGKGANVMNLETADSQYSTKWEFDLDEC